MKKMILLVLLLALLTTGINAIGLMQYEQTIIQDNVRASCAASSILVVYSEIFGTPLDPSLEQYVHERVYTPGLGAMATDMFNFLQTHWQMAGRVKIITYKQYNFDAVTAELKPIYEAVFTQEEARLFELQKKYQKEVKIYDGAPNIEKFVDYILTTPAAKSINLIVVNNQILHWVLIRGIDGFIAVMDPLTGENTLYTPDQYVKEFKLVTTGISIEVL